MALVQRLKEPHVAGSTTSRRPQFAGWHSGWKASTWGDRSGNSLSSAGDVNGDDFDNLIIGMSFRFRGAHDVDEFWNNILNGADSVSEIPPDRWDIESFYSVDREPRKMYACEGGFLDDIENLDAAFFNAFRAGSMPGRSATPHATRKQLPGISKMLESRCIH